MAGRRYAIDKHPQKESIIDSMLAGDSFRTIEDQYNVSHQAVSRYAENVLHKDLAVYIAAQRTQNNLESISDCLAAVKQTVYFSQKKVEQWNKMLEEQGSEYDSQLMRNVLGAVKQVQSSIETVGKFMGGISDVTVVNNISVESSKLVDHVAEILEEELKDNPEVLLRISKRLRDGR